MTKLTDTKCKNTKGGPKFLGDGDGLSLKLTATDTKSWVFRWKENGKGKNMGLGKYPDVSLMEARKRALEARQHVSNGRSPIAERDRLSAATFRDTAFKCLEGIKTSESIADKKTIHQWTKTINNVCAPFADNPISKVTFEDIVEVLKQRFIDVPVSAQRELQRIRRIFRFANAMKWLPDGNPIGQDSGIEQVLVPPVNRIPNHHPALEYKNLPAFYKLLQAQSGIAARALEFTILNNLRTSETLHAKWEHVDYEDKVLTIPAANKKERRELRIPLTNYSILLLREIQKDSKSEYLFPSNSSLNNPLSNMAMLQLLKRMAKADIYDFRQKHFCVHGFRSTFKDYITDKKYFDHDTIENALGHRIGNKSEQSYRRKDAFEKRHVMMEVWHSYVLNGNTDSDGDNVIPIGIKQ